MDIKDIPNPEHAHIVTTPLTSPKGNASKTQTAKTRDAFLRAENEDDDGYDPYSDRPPSPEAAEADPWR